MTFPYEGGDGVPGEDATLVDRSRRILFVACTRASEELVITHTRNSQSPFLEDVDSNRYVRRVYPVPS